MPQKIRFDHHYHAAFDFSQKWMRVQGYSASRNVLQGIVDAAIKKDINMLSIVTEDFGDDIGGRFMSVHSIHNKFARLKEMACKLPFSYVHDCDGPVLRVTKGRASVYVINAQTPLVRDHGHRLDHLVIGVDERNLIPNLLSLEETNQWINKEYGAENIIRVAEHVGLQEHFALGQERFLAEYQSGNYDAFEFNAQMIHPSEPTAWRYKLPVFGKRLLAVSKRLNEDNKLFAQAHGIPFIAGSDGHRIEHLGLAYTEFESGVIDTSGGKAMTRSIKKAIADRKFSIHESYISFFEWARWLIEFSVGHGLRLPGASLTAEHRPHIFAQPNDNP